MSCLGLYGVIAYAVARRTSEIGVRISPGATRARIFRMVSAESATLVLAGIIIGPALAAVVTRVLSSLWFGIGVNDPVTFTIAALLVVAVASVATALPALRASRIDPWQRCARNSLRLCGGVHAVAQGDMRGPVERAAGRRSYLIPLDKAGGGRKHSGSKVLRDR
jgi:hypothetical protein